MDEQQQQQAQAQQDPTAQVETGPSNPDQVDPPTGNIPSESAESLFSRFINGEAIPAHQPMELKLGEMSIKKIEEGGVIITPPMTIQVNFKK
jgi:hypothetical protein